MGTYFTDEQLKSMSFQELTERYMVKRAKRCPAAMQILEEDYNRKLHLEYDRVHNNALIFHEKMRECDAACAIEER